MELAWPYPWRSGLTVCIVFRFQGQEEWYSETKRWKKMYRCLDHQDFPLEAIDVSGSIINYDGLDNLGEKGLPSPPNCNRDQQLGGPVWHPGLLPSLRMVPVLVYLSAFSDRTRIAPPACCLWESDPANSRKLHLGKVQL